MAKWCRLNGKQCRPWSDCFSRSSLIWVYTVCPGLSVQKLRIITVKTADKTMKFQSSDQPSFCPQVLCFSHGKIVFLTYQAGFIGIRFESQHDKTNKMTSKASDPRHSPSLIRVLSSLLAWRNHGSLASYLPHSEDSDETAWMLGLIWSVSRCPLPWQT